MSGGTIVPRNECPGGQFFQGDIHTSPTPATRNFRAGKGRKDLICGEVKNARYMCPC